MILSKVYEDAENKLKRNEITLGEFERLVDIEVIEPKRGKWISKHNGYWTCSECGLSFLFYAKGNYCPNCGARMKGASDETD